MHVLIAAQVAFCFLVLFVAGLFTATFDRLSHQPTGFAADGVINVITGARPAAVGAALGAGRPAVTIRFRG